MEQNLAVPFPRAYWVIPGQVLAGPYPGSRNPVDADRQLKALAGCGIRHVINLMEADETDHEGRRFRPYLDQLRQYTQDVGVSRFPIKDGWVPKPFLIHALLEEIDILLYANRPVYIHYWGGRGRTGTVVGCLLIHRGLATSENVLECINQLRAHVVPFQPSPENDLQRNFIRAWPAQDSSASVISRQFAVG